MKNVYLFRISSSDQGTKGILVTDGFHCKTLELPNMQNKKNISCIPNGEYIVKIRKSPRFGRVYWVTNVPNRSYILIHSGNYAGNTKKGYKSHVAGCILVGSKYGLLKNQLAVLNSRITLRRFMNFMNYDTFKLQIIGE